MATQTRAKQPKQIAFLFTVGAILAALAATSFIEATPLSSSSSSASSDEKIIITTESKSTTSHPISTTQSTQSVAAEAAAEAAAAALGGIQNGLEQALSIVPASINLKPPSESVGPTSSSTPAPTKVVIISEPASSTTTTTSAPSSGGGPEQVVIISSASSAHKHSSKRINTTDTLHRFDLFIDPVCEQLAKLTDKQFAKLQSQLKQINSLAAHHDGVAKCFNEHKFAFDSNATEVMTRAQLTDFCQARGSSSPSNNYEQWSACSARSWSPSIDKELDRALKDRIEGAKARAKHLSGEPKLNHVEMSLIDSIVAHLHDEQVQEIASELEHEQKEHDQAHPQVAVVGHSKPTIVLANSSSAASFGKLSSSSSSSSSIEMIPSSGHHDQIISASPLLSSSQQHHEPLSSLNQLIGEPLASLTGQSATATAASTTTTTATSSNQHQQQQQETHDKQSQMLASYAAPGAEQPKGPEVLIAEPSSQHPALVAGQEQHQLSTTSTSTSTSTTSSTSGHASTLPVVQGHAMGSPALVAPAHPTQQEFAGSAVASASVQAHQEATKATGATILQPHQPALSHDQPGASHMGDLVALAKLQAAQPVEHQQTATATASATTTTTNSHQETVQIVAGPTHAPLQIIPTISPVANFLLNSIDFATKAPPTAHQVTPVVQPIIPAVVQPAALPAGSAVPAPVAVPVSAPLQLPVAAPMPAQAPLQPGVGGEFLASQDQLQFQQQQQQTNALASSASMATNPDTPMSAAAPVAPGPALGGLPVVPQQTVGEPANVVPVVPVATAVAAAQPAVAQQPELLGASPVAPLPVAPSSASVVASTSQQHTEAAAQSTGVLAQQPPTPQVLQPVAAAPIVEPALLKNVNRALDAMANTNSSGIVSYASSNTTNTTLFISSPTTTTTTTTPAPIRILVASDATAAATSTTTGRPLVVRLVEESQEDGTKAPRKRKSSNKRRKSSKKTKSHDEKFARLKGKFGAAQVHDVIVIGDHADGDDSLEDYDDHSEHHDDDHDEDQPNEEHEHSDHHGEGSLILDHSHSASSSSSSSSSSSASKLVHKEPKASSKASAEITTVVEVSGDLDEHKDHEHLLAGLKSGDVVHVDAGDS